MPAEHGFDGIPRAYAPGTCGEIPMLVTGMGINKGDSNYYSLEKYDNSA